MNRRAVVIGAGIAGLATSALLGREGFDVTVLEARTEIGGRAGSWERDGFRFDTGPSWYLMPEVFDHFFRLLGTDTPEEYALERLNPGYRVFFEGDAVPVDVRSGRDEVCALFESIEPGAGPQASRYLDSAAETYRLAIDEFLYSSYASMRPLLSARLLRKAGRLATLLGQPLDRFIGRRFHDPRLRQILGYPAVFLGTSPERAPSLYHLMSHLDLADGVWYPAGGFTAVIHAIRRVAEREGVRIRTGCAVTRIETTIDADRTRVTGVTAQDGEDVSRTYPAEVVVSAADLHHTETTMLPERLQTYPERWWSRRSAGPGAVLAYLGVRGRLPQLAHHSLFFTRDWTRNFDSIFGRRPAIPRPASAYVCRTSATDPAVAPDGDENLFVLVPVPADPGIGFGGEDGRGDRAVEDVADDAIARIAAEAAIPDLAGRIRVRRTVGPGDFARDLRSWRGGALGPAHTLRQSAFLRGRNASAKVEGLLYAGGSTIPGIGLPMCLISAELAIKRLRGDVSAAPLEEPL